jgi:uncharacterized peroxidase-related enzyme
MFITAPELSPDVERVHRSTVDSQGFVMNLTRAWAWRPDVYEAFAALRAKLTGASSLSKRDQAVMTCAAASQLGDSYCSLAWGKSLAQQAGAGVAAAVIADGESDALQARDRALASWARKVVDDPNTTNAADVEALRAAGLSDQDIFEATAFIAFRLAFSTVNDALGIQPDWELAEQAPAEVTAAVTFGRPPAARRQA